MYIQIEPGPKSLSFNESGVLVTASYGAANHISQRIGNALPDALGVSERIKVLQTL